MMRRVPHRPHADQLALTLRLEDVDDLTDIAGRRQRPLANQLKDWLDAGHAAIAVIGPEGSGKTRFLLGACDYVGRQGGAAMYLSATELLGTDGELLADLQDCRLVCIDDLEVVAGNPAIEEALFHLYNRLLDAGQQLLLAATAAPSAMPLVLPDLASRLRAALVLTLPALNDEERLDILRQRARAAGILIDDTVARYILRHSVRHPESLAAIVRTLDRASLVQKRRLTVPFVRQVLGW